MTLNKVLKDTYKKYKTYIPNARRQASYAKDNFSYEKMKEKLDIILENNVTQVPKQVDLKLPKLKKSKKKELPKLELPKLQKI